MLRLVEIYGRIFGVYLNIDYIVKYAIAARDIRVLAKFNRHLTTTRRQMRIDFDGEAGIAQLTPHPTSSHPTLPLKPR